MASLIDCIFYIPFDLPQTNIDISSNYTIIVNNLIIYYWNQMHDNAGHCILTLPYHGGYMGAKEYSPGSTLRSIITDSFSSLVCRRYPDGDMDCFKIILLNQISEIESEEKYYRIITHKILIGGTIRFLRMIIYKYKELSWYEVIPQEYEKPTKGRGKHSAIRNYLKKNHSAIVNEMLINIMNDMLIY